MTNFEFRFGYIRIFVVFSLRIRCYVNWFHFYCSTSCVIVFIDNIYWQYWQYRQIHQDKTFFEIAVMCLKILFFRVLINLSATIDFPSLRAEYISMLFIFKNFLKSCKIHPLYQSIFHLVCNSGMNLSPTSKSLFTISFIFIHLKTKQLIMEFNSTMF